MATSAETTVLDALVVGAGFSGVYALARLRDELGLRVNAIDKASDVGGTWYWNRYPGARCDSESIYYCFSDRLSPDILMEWNWSERYAAQPEILSYFRYVADKTGVRDLIHFQDSVASAHYDAARACWKVTTSAGKVFESRYLMVATGCLHTSAVPSFPGMATFKGDWYHTAHWPHEPVDFTGRRVAVIGTGATGVQVITETAKVADHLYVFQRTPNYCLPARNRPLTEGDMAEVKAQYLTLWETMRKSGFGLPYSPRYPSAKELPADVRNRVLEEAWELGGWDILLGSFADISADLESNALVSDFLRGKIRQQVKDLKVAEKLVPKFPFRGRRSPLEHGYYEVFNQDNVTLIDVNETPIQEITRDGIRTSEKVYEVDEIVFATGFDAFTGALFAMDIRGRDGLSLQAKWADGPRTFLGLGVHGFPNLFMIHGPQSPGPFSNMPVLSEMQTDWIVECLRAANDCGAASIEATAEAEANWVQDHNEFTSRTLVAKTDSWWVGSNISGKLRTVYAYMAGVTTYRQHLEAVAANDYSGFTMR